MMCEKLFLTAIALLVALLALVAPVDAAVIGIDSATFATDGDSQYVLTGFTDSDGTYTSLLGATAADVTGGLFSFARSDGQVGFPVSTDPDVLLSDGLVMTTGTANISAADMTLAQTVNDGDAVKFFVIEITGNDDPVVTPLDSSGDPIGSWALNLADDDWSTPTSDVAFETSASGTFDQPLGGLTFTLADFTGGSGTLTGVAGLRLTDSGAGFDPALVGTTPEPATMGLLALGTLAISAARRRRHR